MSKLGTNVLIVEDNEDISEIMGLVLSTAGYQVTRAANGKEALNALGQFEQKLPCTIILDLMMPVMNGWELLSQINNPTSRYYQIPVIISSAVQDADKVARQNNCEFLRKPISMAQLTKAVGKHCDCALS